MTADSPVAWLNCLIDRGRSHFVEGKDLRTQEAGIEWQRRADQLEKEAKAGVKDRSPDDAVRLETLSPYPLVGLPLGNPWWKPPPALFTASCTSSVKCEENHPVSYFLALINRLEEIARDWRATPPLPPRRFAAAERRTRVSLNTAETKFGKWLIEKLKAPRTKTKMAWQDEVLGREMFPGLSARAFLRAWTVAVAESTTHQSWHKPGPVGSSERAV